MDDNKLDALIYPTWSNPPRLIGDLNTPHGDDNQLFAPSTGFPAITVPMGYSRQNILPAGLQFFGRAWDEFRLIRLAYGSGPGHTPPASTRNHAGNSEKIRFGTDVRQTLVCPQDIEVGENQDQKLQPRSGGRSVAHGVSRG